MKKLLVAIAALLAHVSVCAAQNPGNFPAGYVYGNNTAATKQPSAASLTSMFDRAFCGTDNSVLARVSGSWACTTTLIGLSTPTVASGAATKGYVDGLALGLNPLSASRLATAAVLPNTPTYSNGAAGVGATLTAGSNTPLTVDGSVVSLNDIVLVKNQAAPEQNGQFYSSAAGSGAAPWVLTRCTVAACGVKYDTAATMIKGSYSYITAGSTNAATTWAQSTTVGTVGTDAVSYTIFSGPYVTSWNTRTGAVTPQTGDFTVSQITGAAPLASPTFTGDPRAPTPTTGDSDTSIATTAFIQSTFGNIPVVYLRQYDATACTGSSDTAAFDAAQATLIARGGGAVILPNGTCRVGTTRTITGAAPICFVGQGKGGPAGPGGNPPSTLLTKLLWTGGSGLFFNFSGILNGWCLRDMWIDHASAGNTSVVIDGASSGDMTRVYLGNCGATSCITVTGSLYTASWNSFQDVTAEDTADGTALILLTGDNAGGNSSHNNWYNLRLTPGGTRDGIRLNGNDNDNFYGVYMFCAAGTGYGVRVVPITLGGFQQPTDNTFFGLETCAGANRAFYQPSGISTGTVPATIYGYSVGNGQELPTANGSPLLYTLKTGFMFNNALATSCAGLPAGSWRSNGGVVTVC